MGPGIGLGFSLASRPGRNTLGLSTFFGCFGGLLFFCLPDAGAGAVEVCGVTAAPEALDGGVAIDVGPLDPDGCAPRCVEAGGGAAACGVDVAGLAFPDGGSTRSTDPTSSGRGFGLPAARAVRFGSSANSVPGAA